MEPFTRVVMLVAGVLAIALGIWSGVRHRLRMGWWFALAGVGFVISGLAMRNRPVAWWVGWVTQMVGLLGALVVGVRQWRDRKAG